MYVASGGRVFTDAMCKWGGDVFLRFTADAMYCVPTKTITQTDTARRVPTRIGIPDAARPAPTKKARVPHRSILAIYIKTGDYPKNEMSTPAATAEPITPEMLLDIQ